MAVNDARLTGEDWVSSDVEEELWQGRHCCYVFVGVVMKKGKSSSASNAARKEGRVVRARGRGFYTGE